MTLKLKTGLRGGKLAANHNQPIRVKTSVRAGKLAANHNQSTRK